MKKKTKPAKKKKKPLVLTLAVTKPRIKNLPAKISPAKKKKKRRNQAMTDEANLTQQQRHAPPAPKKPDNKPDDTPELVTHSEHVAALEAEAEKQAEFNTAIADKQMEAAHEFSNNFPDQGITADPDEVREASMQEMQDANDPKKREANAKAAQDARAKNEAQAAKK
jgi:hypothetical protein